MFVPSRVRYTTPPLWLLGTLAGDMWMTRFGSRRDCVTVMGWLGRLKSPHWLPLPAGTGKLEMELEGRDKQTHEKNFLPAEIWVLPFQIFAARSQTPDRLISSVSSARPPPWSSFSTARKRKRRRGKGESRWRLSLFVIHCRMRGGG